MGILTWIVFGFIAGTVAGMVTGRRASGCISRIVVGILGALVGGSLARAAGVKQVSFESFTLSGLLVAILGSSLLLLVLEALSGRSRRPRG
ncbi:MAG: GlsB/YeaQ/YmgE family stress response membrane protein [Actinomycetota bacterium]|nr:GlsB/YeaQ/YmgE family stress response membrane protein [Actinomycetota bacterium]